MVNVGHFQIIIFIDSRILIEFPDKEYCFSIRKQLLIQLIFQVKSHLHLTEEYQKKYIISFYLEETLETRCYVKNPKCYEDVLLLNL